MCVAYSGKRFGRFKFLLVIGLVVASVGLAVAGYQVIEEMEQYIQGTLSTVRGRPTWEPGITIDVYIPSDPEGEGAESEVRAACRAWEEKLRSETNANLSFRYHVGESAPEITGHPPYVLEIHWTDEEATDEPGRACPHTDVRGTDTPGVYERVGHVLRGDIYINRNQSGGQPYTAQGIYNIALHEFGHIFGLDHKSPEQDSVIMDDRGIDDPDKKHPIKDDDVRGLQDLYGRSEGSTVPPEPPAGSAKMCCLFECGGVMGCEMVGSKFECDARNGVLAEGVCETTSQEEQDMGILGRCNGSLDVECEECRSDLGTSHSVIPQGPVSSGDAMALSLVIGNSGGMPTQFSVSVEVSPWVNSSTLEVDGEFAPGSDPFNPPPAVSRCILPGTEATATYRAMVNSGVPVGEVVATTWILENLFTRELYVFTIGMPVSEPEYISALPEDIVYSARMLAWASGFRHITYREERWDASEYAPREACSTCGGAPMCVVCMEYDIGTYDSRPGVTSELRMCLSEVKSYLRSATRQETEILAAVYWTSYWDGRWNRNDPGQ